MVTRLRRSPMFAVDQMTATRTRTPASVVTAVRTMWSQSRGGTGTVASYCSSTMRVMPSMVWGTVRVRVTRRVFTVLLRERGWRKGGALAGVVPAVGGEGGGDEERPRLRGEDRGNGERREAPPRQRQGEQAPHRSAHFCSTSSAARSQSTESSPAPVAIWSAAQSVP